MLFNIPRACGKDSPDQSQIWTSHYKQDHSLWSPLSASNCVVTAATAKRRNCLPRRWSSTNKPYVDQLSLLQNCESHQVGGSALSGWAGKPNRTLSATGISHTVPGNLKDIRSLFAPDLRQRSLIRNYSGSSSNRRRNKWSFSKEDARQHSCDEHKAGYSLKYPRPTRYPSLLDWFDQDLIIKRHCHTELSNNGRRDLLQPNRASPYHKSTLGRTKSLVESSLLDKPTPDSANPYPFVRSPDPPDKETITQTENKSVQLVDTMTGDKDTNLRAEALKKKKTSWGTRRVLLNVGGAQHEVMWRTLARLPNSRLGRLCQVRQHECLMNLCDDYNLEKNEFFFDRNATSFDAILNFYRSRALHLVEDMCVVAFKDDLDYWGINELFLHPCCQQRYYQRKEIVEDEIKKEEISLRWLQEEEMQENGQLSKTRLKIWQIVEKPHYSMTARVSCHFAVQSFQAKQI